MDCKDEQCENALSPILVTELGMVTECKDEHHENALSPILVTELGIVTECKDKHTENALSPMLVTESGILTDCKDEQSSNALSPMLVTESGMIKFSPFDKEEISFRLSEVYRFPSNIVKCFERLITLAGQFENGFPLIIVTDSGMVTECKDGQA